MLYSINMKSHARYVEFDWKQRSGSNGTTRSHGPTAVRMNTGILSQSTPIATSISHLKTKQPDITLIG